MTSFCYRRRTELAKKHANFLFAYENASDDGPSPRLAANKKKKKMMSMIRLSNSYNDKWRTKNTLFCSKNSKRARFFTKI